MKLFEGKIDSHRPKDHISKMIAGASDGNYIEHKSEGDEQISIEEYLQIIRPYVHLVIDNLRASSECKIELIMRIMRNACCILRAQSVLGRNKCMRGSSNVLCYGCVQLFVMHNSFASYGGDIICACCANKTECQ